MNKRTIQQLQTEYLQSLTGRLVYLNNTGKYTGFLSFSGHVCSITIRIYRGQWSIRKKAIFEQYIPIDCPLSEWEIKEGRMNMPQMIDYIDNLIKQTK